MIKNLFLALFICVIFFSSDIDSVFAHPGNTAADGCHYCRTNCDKWGVPWNERHCHGGAVAPVQQAQQVIYLTSTPIPVRTYVVPTNTSAPTFIPSPTLTVTPTIKPTKVPAKIKKTTNRNVSKIAPTPALKKSFWRWLLGL